VALDALGEPLLDANRTIAQPNKITVIFGRKITKQYRGKLQTGLQDLDLPNPVIRSHYGHGFIKQYVRDHVLLRTEPATNNVNDYAVNKAIDHLPALRQKLSSIVDNYLNPSAGHSRKPSSIAASYANSANPFAPACVGFSTN
jgi:hypothetical protein